MQTEKKKIFIVDDEVEMLEAVAEVLEEHFNVVTEEDSLRALDILRTQDFDGIILDINMPKMTGFDLFREVEKHKDLSSTAVMFLSSITSIDTKVAGLNLGVDDYIIKPVQSKELIARVRNRINRIQKSTNKILQISKTTLNADLQKVETAGELVDLTPTEYKIFYYLLKNVSKVISKDELAEKVWPNTHVGYHTIDTHVSNLRKKLIDDRIEVKVIKNQGIILDECM